MTNACVKAAVLGREKERERYRKLKIKNSFELNECCPSQVISGLDRECTVVKNLNCRNHNDRNTHRGLQCAGKKQLENFHVLATSPFHSSSLLITSPNFVWSPFLVDQHHPFYVSIISLFFIGTSVLRGDFSRRSMPTWVEDTPK